VHREKFTKKDGYTEADIQRGSQRELHIEGWIHKGRQLERL